MPTRRRAAGVKPRDAKGSQSTYADVEPVKTLRQNQPDQEEGERLEGKGIGFHRGVRQYKLTRRPSGVGIVSLKLTGVGIDAYEVDPLVVKQVLQQGVFLDDVGDATRRRFQNCEQTHRFVIVPGAVINALQR